jgi:hypothetical protein
MNEKWAVAWVVGGLAGTGRFLWTEHEATNLAHDYSRIHGGGTHWPVREGQVVHLLKMDCRGSQCGAVGGGVDSDINFVTCPDCILQHDNICEDNRE